MDWEIRVDHLRRTMGPAQMEPWEELNLRDTIDLALEYARKDSAYSHVKIPGVTKAGRPYLLNLDLTGGKLNRIDADHEPDLSSPIFDGYTDFRIRAEARLADMAKEERD